jgi:hypothetical protein
MARTYEPIASASPSAAANVEFTSISGSFTDLVLVYHLIHSVGNEDMWLRYNSDTGNNYSATMLYGTGSSAGSARLSNQSRALLDYYAIPGTSEYAMGVVQIMSYSNSNVYTTALSAAARAGNGVDRVVSLWRNTNAVTTVTLLPGAGTITGTVALYGIKAA